MSQIKLVIFDLDGVLVDSRELHFLSLNKALEQIDTKYIISKEEHLSTYDGLSTTKKLNILSEKKNLPIELHKKIWQLKINLKLNISSKFFDINFSRISPCVECSFFLSKGHST